MIGCLSLNVHQLQYRYLHDASQLNPSILPGGKSSTTCSSSSFCQDNLPWKFGSNPYHRCCKYKRFSRGLFFIRATCTLHSIKTGRSDTLAFTVAQRHTQPLIGLSYEVELKVNSAVILVTDVIFFDFKKAFDTVCHYKLLAKLKCYGICGNLLAWIEAFLLGRRQSVRIGDSFYFHSCYQWCSTGQCTRPYLVFIIYKWCGWYL